jgi:hypothetical protein
MPSVVMLNVVMLNVVMLSVVMLNVVMLSVDMLSIVVPWLQPSKYCMPMNKALFSAERLIYFS